MTTDPTGAQATDQNTWTVAGAAPVVPPPLTPPAGHLCRLPVPASYAETCHWWCELCGSQWTWAPTLQQWQLSLHRSWPSAGTAHSLWADEVLAVNARLPADDDGTSPLISQSVASSHRAMAARIRHGLAPDYRPSLAALRPPRRPILVDGRDVSTDVGHWVRPGEYHEPPDLEAIGQVVVQIGSQVAVAASGLASLFAVAADRAYAAMAHAMAQFQAQVATGPITRLLLDVFAPTRGWPRHLKPRRYRAKRPPTRQPAGRAWHQYATRRRHR